MTAFLQEFIEQLITPHIPDFQENNAKICECHLGELCCSSAESYEYTAKNKCNLNGVCAYIAIGKHQARIKTKKLQQDKAFTENQFVERI